MTIEDAEIFQRAVRHAIEQRDDAARETLQQLSRQDPLPAIQISDHASAAAEHAKRASVSTAMLARVLTRDGWRCRYCGRRLVVAGVIEIVGALYPDEFPFPPGHHMPVRYTHPAAIRMYPNVDHVIAGSQGGSWVAEDNLAAACTPCNERKSDRSGWLHCDRSGDPWHGLTEHYRPLLQRVAGDVRPYHANWLRALDSCAP